MFNNEENYEVHPAIAAAMPQNQEQEAPEVETTNEPTVAATNEPTKQAQRESDKEINLRILRERAERAERERDEILRLAQQQTKQAAPTTPTAQDEDFIGIGSDDIVEGKHLSRVQKEIKQLKEELNKYKQQYSTSSAEIRLKNQYPDFDRVVTRENVELLTRSYPELAETLRNSPDLYTQGSAAYTLIKKFVDQPVSYELQQAERNITKPRPTNSISPQQGDTPLSRANAFANGLTDDLKAQLIKEMNEYRKGY